MKHEHFFCCFVSVLAVQGMRIFDCNFLTTDANEFYSITNGTLAIFEIITEISMSGFN
jgi:hypothetical protein